jgi:integrase
VPDFELTKIRTSPNWYVTWTEGGRSQRVSTRTSSRTEADAFLAAFRLEAATEPLADLTIPQALDWYWDTHAKSLFRPDSAKLAIRYLKAFFGTTYASALTLAKQEAYAAQRRNQGAGDESIRRDLSVLAAALNRAVKYHKLDRAPPFLSLTPAPPRERWLTRKEVARLFRQMRKPVRDKIHRHVILFTRLALYTGARTGAILDLTWERVDFDRGLIDYRKPGRRETKKRRTITPMTRKVRRMLLHAKKHSRSTHVVSWAGERIDRVAKAVNAHAVKAGVLDFSPHVLRHTFASWAVQKRVPIYTVGKALGQTVASTTERYAKLAPDDVLAAMEAASRK